MVYENNENEEICKIKRVTCWCWADGVIGVRGGVGGTNAFCCCLFVDCVDWLAPRFNSAARKFSLFRLTKLANCVKSAFCWHALFSLFSFVTFMFAVSWSASAIPFDWLSVALLNCCIWLNWDNQNCANWFNCGCTSITECTQLTRNWLI